MESFRFEFVPPVRFENNHSMACKLLHKWGNRKKGSACGRLRLRLRIGHLSLTEHAEPQSFLFSDPKKTGKEYFHLSVISVSSSD
ncbi:MAG: hypothetical protein ABIA63_09455 [bacterium]